MNLAWITVNYHQERYLKEWRESINWQTVSATNDVFVVDNSSSITIGTIDAVVLQPRENLGYFGGFNYCLDCIDGSTYDAVVLCNPDVTFAPNFVQELQDELSKHQSMIIAPRITLDSGVEQNPNIANPPTTARRAYYALLFSSYRTYFLLERLSRILKSVRRQKVRSTESREIYMPHGACFIATREFFKIYSRLDQRVFLWGEEAFLRYQVATGRGQIWFVPTLRVIHHEHSATSQIDSKRRFALMRHAYLLYRNLL